MAVRDHPHLQPGSLGEPLVEDVGGVVVQIVDDDVVAGAQSHGPGHDVLAFAGGKEDTHLRFRRANEPGVLGKLATLVGANHGNITNLRMTDRSLELFTLSIDIEVQDVKHLADITAALRALAVVESVERLRG